MITSNREIVQSRPHLATVWFHYEADLTDSIATKPRGFGWERCVWKCFEVGWRVVKSAGSLSKPADFEWRLRLGCRLERESQKTGDRGGEEELKDKLWD